MRRLVLAAFLAGLLAPAAHADDFRVVVVPRLDLNQVADRGAVGLLIPGAGPKTSAASARAALERGTVRNSLLGGLPEGEVLIKVETSKVLPDPPAIVLELPSGGEQPNDRRYAIAVLGGGHHGILVSERTRLPGLVAIIDVAPTALGREDGLTSRPRKDAPAVLAALDRRIRANGDARAPLLALCAALVLALALVVPAAAVPALASLLVTNLVLGAAGTTRLWVLLVAATAAVVAGGLVLARSLRTPTALGLALVAVLFAYLVAAAVDTQTLALSPLGPTQNARFYGLSNLLSTLLLVPALAGAAILAARFGAAGFIAVGAVAIVTVGFTRLGADGGGAIVMAVGLGLLALGIWGKRALLPLVVAAVVVGSVAALDAVTGSGHLPDAVRNGISDDVVRRIELSYARAVSSWAIGLLVVAGIAALAALASFELRGRRRPVLAAFAAAIAASLVLNDSPNDVVVAGLLGYLTLAASLGSGLGIHRQWRGLAAWPSRERQARIGRAAAP